MITEARAYLAIDEILAMGLTNHNDAATAALSFALAELVVAESALTTMENVGVAFTTAVGSAGTALDAVHILLEQGVRDATDLRVQLRLDRARLLVVEARRELALEPTQGSTP